MNDTQWPNFEVFIQDKVDEPHRNAGSVHAPDAEIALYNARDVFVRRPNCLNLWVAPANQILAKTDQQLADGTWLAKAIETAPKIERQSYYIFQKKSQKASEMYVTHVGEVEAQSTVEALSIAIKTFKGDKEQNPWVWWVCPAKFITRSKDDDMGSMFEPALNKPYRHQNYYHTVATMHNIKVAKNLKKT